MQTIFDFSTATDTSRWTIENDTVMGGRSTSRLTMTDDGHGHFSGHVSLENNGGFAQVKHQFEPVSVADHDYLVLKIKGDGKRYQLRLKEDLSTRHTYIHYFDTTTDWQELKIALNEFKPTYRGEQLNMPSFDHDQIVEVGILIGNKKEQNFSLLIDRISLK